MTEGDELLGTPFLRWDGSGRPHFELPLEITTQSALHESSYELLINGTPKAMLILQPDGTYSLTTSLIIGMESPDIAVDLAVPNKGFAAHFDLTLWNPGEDVTVWDLQTGYRLDDPYTVAMGQRKDYALLTADDLRVEPAPSEWVIVGGGTHRLSYLPVGWPADLRVLMGHQHIWSPSMHKPVAEPDWAKAAQIRPHKSDEIAHIGGTVVLAVHPVAPDADVRFVRVGGEALTFTRKGAWIILAPLLISANLAVFGGTLTISLTKDGVAYRIRRDLPLSILGAVRKANGVWEHVASEKSITIQDASAYRLKLYVPEKGWQITRTRHPIVMEGVTTMRTVPKRALPLHGLAGYGDALTVHRSAFRREPIRIEIITDSPEATIYQSETTGELFVISRSVIDSSFR